ncbi:biotin--[acetyl-CoA-carboxylase] ligase [Roseibium aggregatum]|uniref:biotin--[biotin carboxyl-carrier protein] ligase n=1 Tax=Roseibium aggregatum TaxID=187304 RepID=A0A939EDL2_9HYPH|nr:biotin--[acetyl-CoA-carboxylase] ligase [Roseibium aggregatum]MBN9670774.1 biotin--[acetyl-CoA-carboxylase] ligase [Roseibium aggregatum]
MTQSNSECPAPGAPDFRYEAHENVGSTNSLCFERARSGHPGRLWIRADVQTSGRGRRGREWSSPAGNMFASLLLVDPEPADRIGELPLVAAVALAEAVDKAAGTLQLVKLKWPNDLLIEGAKLSGILLESETLAGDRQAVVLGFGVNCVSHPPLSLYQATDLRSLGYQVSAESLFGSLSAVLAEKLAVWRQPEGFRSIRKDWLGRAAHLGKEITVRSAQQEITGTFADLDERGHLVIQQADGRQRTIYAGDVFLPGV